MADSAKNLTLASPEIMLNPFGMYDAIRAESPAYKDAVTGFIVVTRYNDVRQVAGDPVTFSNRMDIRAMGFGDSDEIQRMYEEAGFPRTETLVSLDPPRHQKYRSLVDKVFNPKRVRDAEPAISGIVDELITAFPSGAFDFCDRFAVPLPMRIIAQQLGLPDERLKDFKRWSDASVDQVQPGRSNESVIRDTLSIIEMRQFFRGEIQNARITPNDSLLSALANTAREADELITDNEIGLLLQLLLAAGNETTTHATASAMYRLAQDAELQGWLRTEPTLIPTFVEEALRLDSPIQGLFRTVTRDTSIGGVPIPEGSIVNIRFGAGNRDPAQFDCPATLDLSRTRNSHLAFGYGIHFCIGSQLARTELRLAFERLLRGSNSIRLADIPEPVSYYPHFVTYGPRHLVVEYGKA
jgi:cytochrome P450